MEKLIYIEYFNSSRNSPRFMEPEASLRNSHTLRLVPVLSQIMQSAATDSVS